MQRLQSEKVQAQSLNLNFHSPLRHQPDLVWTETCLPEARQASDFRADISLRCLDKTYSGILRESAREVGERKACNEKEVMAAASFIEETKQVVSSADTNLGSPIEQVVFLTKFLHQRCLPQAEKPWLFSRLELKTKLPVQTEAPFTIQMDQVLGGRFTRSRILQAGQNLGNIYFSQAA